MSDSTWTIAKIVAITSRLLSASATWLWFPSLCSHTKSYNQTGIASCSQGTDWIVTLSSTTLLCFPPLRTSTTFWKNLCDVAFWNSQSRKIKLAMAKCCPRPKLCLVSLCYLNKKTSYPNCKLRERLYAFHDSRTDHHFPSTWGSNGKQKTEVGN